MGESAMDRDVLRGFRLEDAPFVLRWLTSPEAVLRLVEYRESFNETQSMTWFQRTMNTVGNDRKWATCVNDDTVPVGFTALYRLHRQPAPEFGMLLGDPGAWGKSIGTEATRLTPAQAFEVMKAHRVFLKVLATNLPARRIYERLGFVREGVLRSHVLRESGPCDVLAYGILAGEWRARSARVA
jgi:RimJ/RimL family protein N-acetyltransferase